MKSPTLLNLRYWILLLLFVLPAQTQAQVPVPFTIRYENNLKGDMTLIANSIVNRQTTSEEPNVPYNLLGNSSQFNDNLNMRYIDIDNDPSTFSSSSAVLTLPESGCNKIVYAGLYWSATYRFNNGFSTSPGDGDNVRENDFNQVKLKLPGGSYLDITGQILFDGITSPQFMANSPYACYADITSLVTSLSNPEGEYTLANIRCTQGFVNGGGVSGGWTIFFVYENPQMVGRYITSYDGFAGVRATIGQTDIEYSGFTTLPPPFPVRAKLASAALEGDNRITGDQLLFRASTVPTFTNLQGALKPANNFFNSRITLLDVEFLERTPNSQNTLGYDSDIITINNPANGVLPNNSTAATLRMTSTQDTYFMFFNAFNVEVIEPEIKLVKTVQDIGGNDIGGADVTLGQILDYVITFQNIGNDDASQSSIRDILPVNTTFQSVDVSGAPGVTYTYNPATKELFFSLPDNLVEIGDPIYTIRIRVQVATTCSELEDACSNIIQNQAYTTYQGVLNNNVISDDPSFAGLDSCGFGTPGPANFLVDIDDCIFESNEILCGENIQLTAANGYIGYQWFNSTGVNIGNNQSVTVNAPGVYTVVNTAEPPCIGITQTFNVSLFGASQPNPIIPFADEVVVCPNDGEELPLIFLCGLNDNRLIQTGVNDALSIVWEVLNEGSCPPVGIEDCANKNPSCSWTQVGTGQNFNATSAGQYRVTFNYQNGCFTRFYFNVFTNLLDIQHTVTNIICNTPGSITITNLPSDYEFQLVNQSTGAVLVPYQNSPTFTINQPGAYLVQVKQNGVDDGCVFEVPNIGVLQNNFQVNVITQSAQCNGFGSIRLQALNIVPQYYFSISGPVTNNVGPLMDNDYTFNQLSSGTYTVNVTTDDGCSFTDTVTIAPTTLNLTATISQHITCNQGNIQMSSGGGQPPYIYAIYSFNGVLQNPTAADYQTSVIFDIPFGAQGTYVFIMLDSNNCSTLSNPVTIDLVPNVQYNTTVQNVSCFGGTNGSIINTVTGGNGFQISFQLLDENGDVIASNNSGVFNNLPAGNYTVVLIQSQGNRTCEFPVDHTITEPDSALTGTSLVTQEFNCITQSGSIGIGSVSGGTPPYEYSINGINFSAGSDFTGLGAGTYSITIRDANNCAFVTNPIIFEPLNPPTDLTFTTTAVTCPDLTGGVTLAVTGGVNPFQYEIIAPASASVNNGNNPVFTNLTAGTYTFLVTDSNGCTYQENYTLPVLTPISVSGQTIQVVSCFGGNDGVATFQVNSTNPYNYTIVNGGGTTVVAANNQNLGTITLNNLTQGSYTLTVIDTITNCEATVTVTIAAPSTALDLTTVVSPLGCISNGMVNASATGGWEGYQFTLTLPNATQVGPQNSGVFGNLTQIGNYTVSVTDANGCVVSSNFTITTPENPTATIDASSDLCFDGNGTSITVNAAGGVAPYSFSINGGTFQSGNTFANLIPGTYTITVRDSLGCTTTVFQTIAPALIASATLQKGLDCTASPDAVINVNINGGNSPFNWQVSINGGAFSAPISVTGAFVYITSSPGNYQFQITDALGCVFTTGTINVAPITNPDITAVTQVQPILCHGAATGSINIAMNTTLGTPPFVFEVVNTTTGVNYGNQTAGLTAGAYTLSVTDANGCTDTATITLNEPNPIVYNVATVDITCNNPGGTTYGEIIVENVSGGTAPYTYVVTNNFGFNATYNTTTNEDHAFQILDFGIYAVTITDANGCNVLTSNIIIASPPDDLLIDVSTSTADCTNGGTAIITVTSLVSSGNFEFGILEFNTLPYTNNYQPGDPGTPETSTFTGLIPGVIYTFVVHDLVTDCYYFKTADLPINTPSNLTSTIDLVGNVGCTGSGNGFVNFTFNNYNPGATAVNYTVYNAQSNVPTTVTGTSTPLSGGAVSVTNLGPLAPGTYFILFTEVGGAFDGCTAASIPFTISESVNLLEIQLQLIKNDNCQPNAGQIAASGAFGTAPYEFQLTLQGDPAPTVSTWAGASNNVFSVEGGTYEVYIKDANGCIQSATIFVPTDLSPEITATITNQCTASEGLFSIDISRIADGVGPYSYSVNGGSFIAQNNANFTLNNLVSGTYTMEIRDANGCGNTVSVTVFPPVQPSAIVTALSTCADNDGVITTAVIGGSGDFTFTLETSTGTVVQPAQTSNVFNNVSSENYNVIVIDTLTGCTASSAVSITTPTPVDFTVTHEDISCFGANDGWILATLGAGNDNPPYVYTLNDGVNPAVVQNNGMFTNISAGNYTLSVTSDRGCEATETIIISEPSSLQVTATSTAFSCGSNNLTTTAVITVTISNDTFGNPSGTAPYLYSLNGGSFVTTNTFEVADNGSVQNLFVTVRDANNCEVILPVVLSPLPEITAVAVTSVAELNCIADGVVVVTVSGGSGNFSFALLPQGTAPVQTPGPGINSVNFTLTQPGSYTFEVADLDTGCSMISAPFEIAPFNTIAAAITASTPVSCFGGNDGTLTFTVTGYSGPFNYVLLDSNGVTLTSGSDTTANVPLTVSGVPAGNIQVVVTATASPFCEATSNTFNVGSPADALQSSAEATAPVTCDNNAGEIFAQANGGWGSYQYQLTNTSTSTIIQPFGGTNLFTGLAAGNYTVTVQDAGGCEVSTVVVLVAPTPITATFTAAGTSLLCHGDTTASVSVSGVSGGQGSYQYILNIYDATGSTIIESTGAQITPTFTGLGAGIYSITIVDGWNCDITGPTFSVTEPTPVLGSLNLTSALTCTNNAVITVSGSGGTAPYQYSQDGVTYTTQTVYNVGPGTYQFFVRDANNCAAVLTNQITILPIPELNLNLNLNSANINCSGESTGVIIADAIGGLGNYQYTLLDNANNALEGPQTIGIFSSLAAGSYVVRVDSGDCNATSAVINITNPEPLVVSNIAVNNVLCHGETNGSVQVTGTGGTGTIKYAISPNLNQFVNNGTFDNLMPGDYIIIVQDQLGCFTILNITIIEPDPLEAEVINAVQELCVGDANGAFELSIIGGTAPYSTSLNNPDPANFIENQLSFSGLSGGQDYFIFVRDANGCETIAYIFLDTPVLLIPEVDITYACDNNVPSNTVTVSVNVESQGFVTYALDGGTYQDNPVFTNLSPGAHEISVQHQNGCIKTVNFSIDDIQPLTLDLSTFTNVTCFGADSGSVTATTTGGSESIQYAISTNPGNFSSQNVFSNLPAGTYIITARDAIGCEISENITIAQPDQITPTVSAITQELCINDNNASFTLTITGGVAPYATSLNNINNFVVNQLTYSGLTGGQTYTVFVRDANNCVVEIPVTFEAPVTLNPTVGITYNCDNNTVGNSVTISVSSNVANQVSYAFDGGPFQTGNTFTNVSPGNHTVTVRHSNGCEQVVSFNVQQVQPIDAKVSITGANCHASSTGSVTVTASGGSGALSYAISPNLNNFGSNNVFSNLAAGTYTIIVRDALGCEVTLTAEVIQPNPLVAVAANVDQDLCVGDNLGSITVGITGGTAPFTTSLQANGPFVAGQFSFANLAGGQTYTVYVRDANGCETSVSVTLDSAVDINANADVIYGCISNNSENLVFVNVNPAIASVVTYSLNGGPFQTSNEFANLANGNYTILVMHPNGCSDQVSVNVQNFAPLGLTLVESSMNQITASVIGGTAPYSYFINGLPNGNNPVFQIFQTGNYTITVRDANGCEVTETIFMTFINIEIPNFFTPNDDGQNDTWAPNNLQGFPNIKISVHDRYGRKITLFGYTGSWDGKYNVRELPTGDYWYTIVLDNGREIVGNVPLYR